ncbi:hypothetical protein GALL_516340 [mine drainage metagenome]|uniref:Uncharacterized protein n=1 Tax=mine drainage metagenome TaxID=410659 RepID=A0A1J5P7R5_9ZZZZ
MRHALPVAVPVHVADQAADIFARQVAFERPRRVGVTERGGEIGHVRIHHALVVQRLGKIDHAAVDGNVHAAEHLQHKSGRGDDDVGLQLAAILEPDAAWGEGIDLFGDDRGALLPDGIEQVAVGHQTEPLIPGIVARGEVGRDVVVGPERHPDAAEDQLLDPRRFAPCELEEIHAEQHVAPADQMIGELFRQITAQFVGEGILRRA